MTAGNGRTTAEAELHALIDEQARAIRAKDVDGSLSNHAPDVLLFDVVNPLRSVGSDAARKRLAAWFASFRGPIGYELRDLAIVAGDDVAFCHSLNRVNATTTDGQKLDMWWRATVGYRRLEGAWMVTHEHASVPFDVASGQASLDLEP
ncbi:MAG: YybH family protein [Geminicoccaceae bacterium]